MGAKRTVARVSSGRGRGRRARQSTSGPAREQDVIPEVYQDMLAEAARNPLPQPQSQAKTVKRRKLDDGSSNMTSDEPATAILLDSSMDGVQNGDDIATAQPAVHKQTVFDDDFDTSGDDSDDDFEDVDLEADVQSDQTPPRDEEPLRLDLSRKPGPDITPSARRRKITTVAERKVRLDVHKWHILCLLGHLQRRNHWCGDEQVQSILKPLLPRTLVRLLHLDSSKTQFQRNHSFNTAIEEISKIWRSEWKITEQGMRRAYWREDPDEFTNVDDHPDPIDQRDFLDAAKSRSGSRDLGAQLFCSLLRAVAVDTRLVASLQPLPFSGIGKGTTPEGPRPKYAQASSLGGHPQRSRKADDTTPKSANWRLYDAESERSTPNAHEKKKKKGQNLITDSPYPIFWVEVFNEALQKWIPLDPLVRSTINKPKTGFEPAANDPLNSLSYVIAFEEDGWAKDVTRRYAQFYNGKTRKLRVEYTKGGQRWWRRTMSLLEEPFPSDRDAIENAELLAREESEPMPKNVQDFKNHPHYALERHLRRNEVIHPRREIGKVSVGPNKDGRLEPVYRRKDVVAVKTADQWYRLGRDVKIGERPLKRVLRTKRRQIATEEEDGDEEGAMLYAGFQTRLYMPPDVLNDRVPKNAYGNLDVFVPSMIPAGGIHLQHPDAAKAARILGISYADAVTGFEFKGRQGTAVTNGIVTATTYREALVEVLHGLVDERARTEDEKRSSIALQMWKKFLTALRIRERVKARYGEGGSEAGGDDKSEDDVADETYKDGSETDEEDGGGGFFPQQTTGLAAPTPAAADSDTLLSNQDVFDLDPTDDVEFPIIIHESPHKLPHEQQHTLQATNQALQEPTAVGEGSSSAEDGGGFIVEDAAAPGLFAHSFSSAECLQRTAIANIFVPTSSCKAHQAMCIPIENKPSDAPPIPIQTSPRSKTENRIQELLEPPPPAAMQDDPAPPLSTPPKEPDQNQRDHPRSPSPITTDSTAAHRSASEANPGMAGREKDGMRWTRTGTTSDEEGDEALENGSLLSHDPEDEDAEPEWLADAVDSN